MFTYILKSNTFPILGNSHHLRKKNIIREILQSREIALPEGDGNNNLSLFCYIGGAISYFFVFLNLIAVGVRDIIYYNL